MNTGSVIEGLKAGHVLRRKPWKANIGIVAIRVDGTLRVMLTESKELVDGKRHWETMTMPFTFLDEDIFALDWEIA